MLADRITLPIFAVAGTLMFFATPLAIPPEPPAVATIATPPRPVLQLQLHSDFIATVGDAPADPGFVLVPPPIVDWLIATLGPVESAR